MTRHLPHARRVDPVVVWDATIAKQAPVEAARADPDGTQAIAEAVHYVRRRLLIAAAVIWGLVVVWIVWSVIQASQNLPMGVFAGQR